MTIIYFLEVQSTDDSNQLLSQDQVNELKTNLVTLPRLTELYIFTPADGGHDPCLKDEHPPLLVIQALFNEIESLEKALASPELQKLKERLLALPIPGLRLVHEAMLLESYLGSETSPGLADLSYLVNYRRPAEDEASFLKFYRDHHPASLMKFPAVRRVELGIPVDWTSVEKIERAERMLFCEVSFDNIELLNEALNSDVRQELRRDYERFPAFSGEVTHFPMHRQAIL